MKNLKVISIKGQEVGNFNFPKNFSLVEVVNKQVVFDSVIAEQSSTRQGTHCTKTKAEVSGGGRKPFKQKHTGNARQGSRRNPHFVGGGVVFGPKPTRNYIKGVNRKAHKLAFMSALNLKLNNNEIKVLENAALLEQAPNTKTFFELLTTLKLHDKKVLVVVNENNPNLLISARNLKNVIVKKANQISVRDLLNNKHVLIQDEGFNKILGELQ